MFLLEGMVNLDKTFFNSKQIWDHLLSNHVACLKKKKCVLHKRE